jgi:Helix-turn-helix domain
MVMTINKVFAAEGFRKRNAGSLTYRFFLLDSDTDFVAQFGHGRTYKCQGVKGWARVFAHTTGESAWISTTAEKTQTLLKAASIFLASHRGRRRTLGDLLLLQSPRSESLPALHTVFRRVVGQVESFKVLPLEELVDVLLGPRQDARDLFIGGAVDPTSETLALTRGNLETVVVPLSMFRPSGKASPDPSDFAVEDYGHTVRLGEYEAAADAILYEVDSEFRKRLNARRRQEDRGFGASLRRLRLQRRLARADFPGLSAKTIARIERGDTGKPHGKTLAILAKTLGVKPDEIETY